MEGQGIIERWLRDGIQDLLDNQKRKEEIHGSLFRYPTPAVLIIEAKHEWKTTWRKNYEFCLSHVEIEATGAGVRQEVSENSVVLINIRFSSLQSLSHVRLFATPWIAARQASLSITNSRSLPNWVSDAIQPFHSLSFLLLLPSIFPSIRVFSNESALCIRWPKYWSFSFNQSLQWIFRTDFL